MSDPKRDPLHAAVSAFSDDIETICAQMGFDPALYIEFPRNVRGPQPLAPEPGAAPQPAPDAPASQEAGPVNAEAALPVRPTPVMPLPSAVVTALPAARTAEPAETQKPAPAPVSWTSQSFATAGPFHSRVPVAPPVPARAPQPTFLSRPVQPAQPLPIDRPAEAPAAPASPVQPVQREIAVQGLRAGLRALLEELGGEARPADQRPQRRAKALVMTPAVSGMGCTTLTATLARYYQNRGEGALIFDDREDGLLRLHFQSPNAVAIPIVTRDSAPTLSITWFQEPMARHQMDYRWFLMDTKSVTPALVNAQLSPGSCYVVPVLADMRGVKAAIRLSEQLDSYESEQGRRLAFYFVLNQFDAASRLQEEMRQHLMRRLGGRLAPVAIRWSDDIGAALAEGATVLDYAPASPASQDFASLGEWLAGLG
jgi:hypothetical protein